MFKDWHFVRWIFLIVGSGLGLYAYSITEWGLGMLAIIIAYQAIMNVGCIKFCYPHQMPVDVVVNDTDEIIYEEIL